MVLAYTQGGKGEGRINMIRGRPFALYKPLQHSMNLIATDTHDHRFQRLPFLVFCRPDPQAFLEQRPQNDEFQS